MRFLLLLLIFFVVYFYFRKKKAVRKENLVVAEMVKDEACGIYLSKNEALKVEIDGKIYYFCCKECKDVFLKRYLEQA